MRIVFHTKVLRLTKIELSFIIDLKHPSKTIQICSELKINFDKSELMGVNVAHSQCVELASTWGCKVASFPDVYLEIPLCKGKPRKPCWDKIVEKTERRLSTWKGKYLSIGGRIILLKAVLSSLSVYFLNVFKCPAAVVDKLEKAIPLE